jgi:hypothetical protein
MPARSAWNAQRCWVPEAEKGRDRSWSLGGILQQGKQPGRPKDQQPDAGKGSGSHLFLPEQSHYCDRAGGDAHSPNSKAD